MRFQKKQLGALTAVAVAAAAVAGTLVQLAAPVTVSTSDPAHNAYKAKMGWIAYMNGSSGQTAYDVKAQILVYADGPAGQQDIYVARSTDNGATWSEQNLTHNGGLPLENALAFHITNNKPNIYVAPIGVLASDKGANALITFTSSDCDDSDKQKVNHNLLTGPQPYMCLWAARSTNGGEKWELERLTDGDLDPDEDVPTGFVKADLSAGGFAISYQADPAGLQQGDAEGPGDGASGATVSPGTDIHYTYLSKSDFEAGAALKPFKAHVQQLSNNNANTEGAPGASRANLAISGGTAVLAYEETKGDGTSGKNVIYHSFPYATPPSDSAGTVVNDTAMNARRVRFMLQGSDAINATGGDAATGDNRGVHVVLLWRETASLAPAAPSDIVMRRGIKHTGQRAGSTGFTAEDVLADTPVNLSDTGAVDNALAHRGTLRGDFVSIAYDHTPDAVAADPEKTNPPTGTYNLYVQRSTDGGATWSAARNLSNITDPAVRVVEPRQVATPGTIKLPSGTAATSDPSDVQNRNVMYVSWGTETNAATPVPQDIFLTRTTDQGLNYERVQRLADGATEQSEAQLRTQPDGKTLGALWMQKNAVAGTTDVVYRNGSETTVADPDLHLTASGASFAPTTQGVVTYTLLNEGAGDAQRVVLSGTAPTGLTIVSTSEPTLCAVDGASFTCTVPELLSGQSRAIGVTLGSATAGTYALPAQVVGDVVETDSTDNAATATVTVASTGGGCSASDGQRPLDPVLPALGLLGLLGWGLRRARGR